MLTLERLSKRELVTVVEHLLLLYSSDVSCELEHILHEISQERKKRKKVVI